MANPAELRSALGLGLLYTLVLVAAAALSDWIGLGGLYLVSLVSGLTDVDAITLTTLRLFTREELSATLAVNVVVIAVLSNMVFKSALALLIGGAAMARHAIAGMGAISIGLILAWGLVHLFGF
jgi:uncharacterized membrane protein (DUF4010 family)